ncbi:hypothetical protein L2Y94_13420 [Luteibacter aegosomatis]|uniref:hypothetical protein n=1 Tax=Luteibacter aegosomatis TaxID=2911537 RepID=UPI001FF8E54F|nr:hypothetical protein [Luteibacter aegosomatis]UPG84340.1 hypothetical protein L2Y94_13420 [Luteibacter aegosomatis]
MIFTVFVISIAVVELLIGVGLLSFFVYPVKNIAWPNNRKRVIFVCVGVLITSPALAPAGTLALFPIPLGVLLMYLRSSEDAIFLLKTWWFILPSMLITGLACTYAANRLFAPRLAGENDSL